jgi:hypothetical protein
MTCLSAFTPTDSSAVSFLQNSAVCSSYYPSAPVHSPPLNPAIHPAISFDISWEERGSALNPSGESNPFLFLDLHADIEPYHPSDTAQPGLLLLIGTSMIVLAMFGKRMIR